MKEYSPLLKTSLLKSFSFLIQVKNYLFGLCFLQIDIYLQGAHCIFKKVSKLCWKGISLFFSLPAPIHHHFSLTPNQVFNYE